MWVARQQACQAARERILPTRLERIEEIRSTDRIPYFEVNLAAPLVGNTGGSLFALVVGAYLVVEIPPGALMGFIFAAVGAYGLYTCRWLATEQTLRARFFSGHMKYGAFLLRKEIAYSDIERVEKAPIRHPYVKERTRVLIFPKDGSQTISVPSNMKDYVTKIDLYSWLRAQVEGPAPPSATPSQLEQE